MHATSLLNQVLLYRTLPLLFLLSPSTLLLIISVILDDEHLFNILYHLLFLFLYALGWIAVLFIAYRASVVLVFVSLLETCYLVVLIVLVLPNG